MYGINKATKWLERGQCKSYWEREREKSPQITEWNTIPTNEFANNNTVFNKQFSWFDIQNVWYTIYISIKPNTKLVVKMVKVTDQKKKEKTSSIKKFIVLYIGM